MIPPWKVIVSFLLIGSICACIPQDAQVPDDFALTFSWNTGTLPPQYRYDTVISIGPGLQGEFDYVPGYGGADDPNHWVASFEIVEADRQSLYTYLREKDFFSGEWKTEQGLIGGSTTAIIITAFGKDHHIPSISDLDGNARKKVEAAQDVIRSYVPVAIRAEMEARQKAFEDRMDN